MKFYRKYAKAVGKMSVARTFVITEAKNSRMFRTISNFISGSEAGTGEVDGYENAPYSVINTFQVTVHFDQLLI
jgi:hypothetical protein